MWSVVLQPGSLAWWQFLADRGISGDSLLPNVTLPTSPVQRRILQEEPRPGTAGALVGAHWEVARPLLAAYKSMKDTNCPLFARKFSGEDAASIALLAKNFTTPGAAASSILSTAIST